jgi:putative hydrolase of the HAD superfamily
VQSAAKRFPLGVISDTGITPGRVLRQILERNGLMDFFSVTVFSDETGVAKPQALMFQEAARA